MHAKRPRDEGDEGQPAGQSRGPKRRRCNRAQQDEKYDAIFDLLKRAEERGERMEMRAEENKKEAFEQAQKALTAYIVLSERITHAIVNIGGSNDVSE